MTYKLPHEVPGLARIPEPVKQKRGVHDNHRNPQKSRYVIHAKPEFEYTPPADQVFKPGVGALFISYPKPIL